MDEAQAVIEAEAGTTLLWVGRNDECFTALTVLINEQFFFELKFNGEIMLTCKEERWAKFFANALVSADYWRKL